MTILAILGLLWQEKPEINAEMVDRIALKVNDKIITERELLLTYLPQKSELIRTYSGDNLEAALEELWEQIVQTATDQLLLFEKSVESGVAITEDALESRLQSVKESNGFSDEEFRQAIKEQTGMAYEEYLDYSRRDESAKRVVQSQVMYQIKVEDSEIAKYYDEHQTEFMDPATYRIAEIVILKKEGDATSRFKASTCQESLKNGQAFEDVAQQYSDSNSKENGGDLGVVHYGDFNATIESAVKALQVGDTSDILETESAFFIIKVLEKTEATPQDIDEVEDEIRYRIQEPQLDTKLDEFLEELRAYYLVTRSIQKPASGL